ncbi:intraflagellar transport protein 74 homolog [Amphiura filiformis]|uniref:intraflagellar transport protein 74 homolog n=1 Tax=Amphiura filiformis TaxID=82378 RepID=UPI003B2111A2
MNRPPSNAGRRPTTGARPGSTMRQPPPGTAMRMPPGTGAPGTARPGTRGGVAGGQGVLDARLNVADRPTTQQGLGGMKTGKKGPQRVVMDKSYFLGLLRTKMNELTAENNTLQRNIDTANEENNSYLSYEKRAEALAAEIKECQGQLGDYNTLVDKLNTDTEMDEVLDDHQQLKIQNDREAKSIDDIFTERQEIEQQIQQVEVEIQQCRRMADTLVEDMNPQTKQKYVTLKQTNETLLQQLEVRQQELDALETKKYNLEEELSHSQVKQEAVRLYEQLHELEEKKASLVAEEQARGSPAEERERLLKQVKDDNQEIAGMEKKIKELKEQIVSMQDEIHSLDIDIDEHQGEKNQKYKELKKREETMNEFLDTFEESKIQETERKAALEENICELLAHMSRTLSRQKHMPTPKELAHMQEDLSFKQNEMHKSEATASNLAGESTRLQMDLQKVEQLESKINSELEKLKEHIAQMEKELEIYNNLNKLKEMAEDKKRKLHEEKVTLAKRRDTFKKAMQELSMQYEAIKAQLNENETHAQLGNLERKWQHHEQNNFVMKEFIATKSMESDYRPLVATVKSQLDEYNKLIQDALAKGIQR